MSTSTSINAPAETPSVQGPPSSLFSRVGQVFFSPGKLFESFQVEAPWAGALLLILGVVLAVQIAAFFAITDQAFVDYVKQQMVDQGATQLPPDEMLMQGAKINKMIGIVAGPILTTLQLFFSALVAWLMFSLVGGGKARYPQYVAVIAHAMFIALLGAIVLFPLQIITNQLEMDLSLALVLDRMSMGLDKTSIAHAIASKIEVFNLWTIAVAGIGAAAINRKRGWIGYAGLMFLVYVIFSVGIPQLIKMVMMASQKSA
jgi:hypothetical protein